MGIVVSIDPGIRGTSAAVFSDAKLIACAYVENPAKAGSRIAEAALVAEETGDWIRSHRVHVDALWIEWPRVYQAGGGRTKGQDPNDLRALCAIGGAIAVMFLESTRVCTVEPHAWKGTMTKDVTAVRVLSKLRAEEKSIMAAAHREVAASLRHNITDAVGIGLYGVGRFDRARVIHRESDE